MISTKQFLNVDGNTRRFLSDFIIASDQHIKVFLHTSPIPVEADLVSANDFDLMDNSIIFYTAPTSGLNLTIEVATNIEELGNIVSLPAADRAQISEDLALYYADLCQTIYNSIVVSPPIGGGVDPFNAEYNVERLISAGLTYTEAFIALATTVNGYVYFPNGGTINVTLANYLSIFNNINKIKTYLPVNIIVAAGEYNFTNQILLSNPFMSNVNITGTYTTKSLTDSTLKTGVVKNFTVSLTLDDMTGISVGEYLLIPRAINVPSIDDVYALSGIWKVTDTATDIKINHTSFKDFSLGTFTATNIRVLKTVFKFTGCDGFRVAGCTTGVIEGLAIVGDYSVDTSTGSVGAHGIIVAAPVITGGASSNTPFNPTGNLTLGYYVGVSSFGEQGIAIAGNNGLVANFTASCSNRKRGFYADKGYIRAKYSIASGNGEDGYISDEGGMITSSYAVAFGNGLCGVFAINHGFIGCAYSKFLNNLSSGVEARGLCRIAAEFCTSNNNNIDGFLTSFNGHIDCNGSIASYNVKYGFESAHNAIIDADNVSGTGNLLFEAKSSYKGAIYMGTTTIPLSRVTASFNAFITINGKIASSSFQTGPLKITSTVLEDQNTVDFILTSVNDMVIALGGVNRYTFRAGGVIRPVADNTQSLGDATYRWSTIYAGTGTINTSDERAKEQIRDVSIQEYNAAVKLKRTLKVYKFKDAVIAKGTGARYHFGFIAQEVKAIFESEGLNAFEYGILCYDEWEQEEEETNTIDGQTIIIKEFKEAGNRYGLRYEELLSFLICTI